MNISSTLGIPGTALKLLLALAITAIQPRLAHAATATYKEGSPDPFTALTYSGTSDTVLLTQGGNSTDNLGLRGDFSAGRRDGSGGGTAHGLIRFNIASLTGQYASINSVTLRLYPDFVIVPANITETLEVHRVTAADSGWVEGNGTSFTGFGPEDVGGSTWAFRVQGSSPGTGTPWAGSAGASTPGTDFNASVLASSIFNASTPLSTAYDVVFNDVSFLAAWAAGSNEGLLLKIPNDTTFTDRREIGFWSSEDTGLGGANRPELIINYNSVPEPGVFGLLLVGAVSALSRKRRFATY